MILTAEQNLKIALLYEKAAADLLGVPPQQRIAFARKAKWFRMKARIRAKKDAVSALAEQRIDGAAPVNEVRRDETRLDETGLDEACLDEAWREQAHVSGTAPRVNGARANRAYSNGACPAEAHLDEARLEKPQAPKARPKRYLSIAERIAAARAAQS